MNDRLKLIEKFQGYITSKDLINITTLACSICKCEFPLGNYCKNKCSLRVKYYNNVHNHLYYIGIRK